MRWAVACSSDVLKGIYRIEMTDTGDGAAVEWLGASCRGTQQTKVYRDTCELAQAVKSS